MQVRPVSDVLGAELVDFDITRVCSADEQARLRALFLENHLLLVRGQAVTEEDQTRFVGYFGPVHLKADGGKATLLSNIPGRGIGTGHARLLWHQDGTYGVRPGIATSLWAQAVDTDAVPTLFASAVRVLDALPQDFRERIGTLHAVHGKDRETERTDVRYRDAVASENASNDRFARYEHPIVYDMPHSDRQTLLVSELFTSHVVGLPPTESDELLQDLFSLLYDDSNVYAHHWRTGDVVIWDNMALQHCRPADMGAATRRLRRQSLDGWYREEAVMDWPETVIAYAASD